jgi:tetratricopeptide (TPR) repeat protein
MTQPMPVVRQVYWPALVLQLAAMATLTLVVHCCFGRWDAPRCALIAGLAYLAFCRALRTLLARDHAQGMSAYRSGRFEDAIRHFAASHAFFSKHRRMDRWRWLLFGVASPNPYRALALGNMGYCYGQMGEGRKAIELYEQALRESPGYTMAHAALRMLRAGQAKDDVVPAATIGWADDGTRESRSSSV